MPKYLFGQALWLVLMVIGIALTVPAKIFAQALPAPFGKYTENINGVPLELVRIPAGTFLMGNDRSPNPEEKPAHQVTLKSFYIGQFEITRQQYNIVATTLPKISWEMRSQYIGPMTGWSFEERSPADVVFWDAAVEFCERLTRFTGKKYRLPSEAEWEYACRAGTNTEYSFGNEVNYHLAHFRDITADFSPSYWLLPVGKKGYANPWGLFDMHGNVAEWCLDVEHSNYIGAPTDGSVWTSGGNQSRRIQRGGAYGLKAEFGRSSARNSWSRSVTVSDFGFRVVAEVSPTIGSGFIAATSAANYLPQNLAADSLGSLFGTNLATETKAAASLPLPTTLAGCSVFIKDVLGHEHLAKLLYVSPTQINFEMPANLPTGMAQIFAVLNGNIHSSGTINITPISPGVFSVDATGTGFAAAVVQRVKSNGEQVYEPIVKFDPAQNRFLAIPIDVSHPQEEVFLALFGTGIRARSSLANVSATVGGADVEVLYAGEQGEYAGVDQVNIRLLKSLAGQGEVAILVNIDGVAANPVKIHIQ